MAYNRLYTGVRNGLYVHSRFCNLCRRNIRHISGYIRCSVIRTVRLGTYMCQFHILGCMNWQPVRHHYTYCCSGRTEPNVHLFLVHRSSLGHWYSQGRTGLRHMRPMHLPVCPIRVFQYRVAGDMFPYRFDIRCQPSDSQPYILLCGIHQMRWHVVSMSGMQITQLCRLHKTGRLDDNRWRMFQQRNCRCACMTVHVHDYMAGMHHLPIQNCNCTTFRYKPACYLS